MALRVKIHLRSTNKMDLLKLKQIIEKEMVLRIISQLIITGFAFVRTAFSVS